MKLMSSLLFCVLLAVLPTAFALRGHSGSRYSYSTRQLIESREKQKQMLMNTNSGALIHKTVPLDSEEISSVDCRLCSQCIKVAVLAINKTEHADQTTTKNSHDTLHEDIMDGHVKFWKRPKRFVDVNSMDNMPPSFPIKLSNARKRFENSRSRKAVTVTKYRKNSQVVALKIKEVYRQAANDPSDQYGSRTCRVYLVKDSFDCQAADGPYFLKSELTKNKMHPKLQYQALEELLDKINKQTSSILRKREINYQSHDLGLHNSERKSIVKKNYFNNHSTYHHDP